MIFSFDSHKYLDDCIGDAMKVNDMVKKYSPTSYLLMLYNMEQGESFPLNIIVKTLQ